jgi:uncharacterized protein DUF4365
MADRSKQQKIGAIGHKWLVAMIEEHPDWLCRDLGEDYGIDVEAELTSKGLRGEILKIQIKSAQRIERRDDNVKFVIERRYVEYALACRYPVILIVVDIHRKESWYLWLQDWALKKRGTGLLDRDQKSWIDWIAEGQTTNAGLSADLKAIASWKGETQLVLSLLDALRAAAATYNRRTIEALLSIISANAQSAANASIDAIIDEAVTLGDRMRGTEEGNVIADQLFALARKYGGKISRSTVHDLVVRGDSYSRVGLATLGILYDDFFEHVRSLDLPSYFAAIEPRVAFYCAFREEFPEEKSSNVFVDPTGFRYAGLHYIQPDMHWDKYANRGPSALLDYLAHDV